ncbi:MAG: hypothetical protein JW821_18415, partial [Deltaproteobacteria bacterium]|nr:hypothetical protein [Deltaproteobacteria bacterium]
MKKRDRGSNTGRGRHQKDRSIPGGNSLVSFLLGLILAATLCMALPGIPRADTVVSYRVSMEGVDEGDLRKLLENVSDTVTLQAKPPPSLRLLRVRVERDVDPLTAALRSRGFYGARVRPEIDEQADPFAVRFRIDRGPVYLIASVEVLLEGVSGNERPATPGPREIGLGPPDPGESTRILDAEKAILRWFKRRGFPLVSMVRPKVIVRHEEGSLDVTYRVSPGPKAVFGPVTFTGIETADPELVSGRIPWKEGDAYNVDLVDTFRNRLSGLGLFATVRIIESKVLDDQGRLPITVEATERKHRSLGAGVSYKTDEGPGVKLSWEHRNILGQAERLRFSANLSDFTRAG